MHMTNDDECMDARMHGCNECMDALHSFLQPQLHIDACHSFIAEIYGCIHSKATAAQARMGVTVPAHATAPAKGFGVP